MNIPPAVAPQELYCIDTSLLKTEKEEVLIFMALDTFSGKIVHTEVHPADKEGVFFHFITEFAKLEKLDPSVHKVRVILSLDTGNEKIIEEAFPFFDHVVCNKETCKEFTEPAWEFIYHVLQSEENK